MIDLRRGLPVGEVMALHAILPKLAAMDVLVTRIAFLRQSEEGLSQVVHFDQWPLGLADMRRRMALAAFESRVLALQWIASLIVIEGLKRRLPVDQRKILAVVLGVAFGAIFLVRETRVQPAVLANLPRNFGMALLAFQNG